MTPARSSRAPRCTRRWRTRPHIALLDLARARGDVAATAVAERIAADADLLPDREAKRAKREGETAGKRAHRRAYAATLDHGMQLVGLWLRDVACVKDGVPELVHHVDRVAEVNADAEASDVSANRLRDAVGLVEEARTMQILNPSEELALEALVLQDRAPLALRWRDGWCAARGPAALSPGAVARQREVLVDAAAFLVPAAGLLPHALRPAAVPEWREAALGMAVGGPDAIEADQAASSRAP